MDIIANYQEGGAASKREKEITKILSNKYPTLLENKLVTKGNRFTKNKEEEARKYITDPEDEKLLDEYIEIFFTRQAKEGKAAPEKYKQKVKGEEPNAEPKSPNKSKANPKPKAEPKSPKKPKEKTPSQIEKDKIKELEKKRKEEEKAKEKLLEKEKREKVKLLEKEKREKEKLLEKEKREEEKRLKKIEEDKEKKEEEKIIRISPEIYLFLKDKYGDIEGKPTTYITKKRIKQLKENRDNGEIINKIYIPINNLYFKAKKDQTNELIYIYPTQEEIDEYLKSLEPGEEPDEEPDKEPDEEPGEEPDKEPDEEPDKEPDEEPDKEPSKPIDEPIVEKDKSKSSESSDIAAGVGVDLLDDLIEGKSKKYVLESRKAFVNYINEEFFPELIEKIEDNEEIQNIKLHQLFSKEYLSTDSPYRGLLVYHGLGTGKTATSIVTVEGLSHKMKINVLLPASLETEYINEIKTWGDNVFNIDNNIWKLLDESELMANKKKYNYESKALKTIGLSAKSKLKFLAVNEFGEDTPEFTEAFEKYVEELKTIEGLYILVNKDTVEDKSEYNVSDKFKNKSGFNIFSNVQLAFINAQIEYYIQQKYSFIHYNGWPNITKQKEIEENADINEFLNPDEVTKRLTHNGEIAQRLVNDFNENEKIGINSPFRNEVIVIDEVHNLVNMINNKKPIARQFYEWIKDSVDTKLVFLSGTPVVNEPCEIAILYNMIKGKQNIYQFSVKADKNIIELENELKNEFFHRNSSVEQFHVSKKHGKIIVSVIKNSTNFSSILDKDIIKTVKYNNLTNKYFLDEVFSVLSKIFDDDGLITPTKSDINKYLSDITKEYIFDTDIDLTFNIKQNLFDLIKDDMNIDLTENSNFMDYFFDENLQMPSEKKIFLRRLLMGLTSYYPIGKSSITDMPQITEALIPDRYKDYTISENINIVPCIQSSRQWIQYENTYKKDKLKSLKKMRKGNIYSDNNSDFNIRNRQNCNIIFENDDFRIKKDEKKKMEMYDFMNRNEYLTKDKIKMFSPKFFNILDNMGKFINNSGEPTGKIMYYSDFRGDGGSEIFEQILIANGYSKFNYQKDDINTMDKGLRYTFITGKEGPGERKANKVSFNDIKNINGEYIQLILISSAGAEGISLFGVRQVHIMEPYWNFGRMNQVFGRAIRFKSHKDLPEDKRNVEQYLYISFLPYGDNVESIYKSLKENQDLWPEVRDLNITENIKETLLENHTEVFNTINKILSVKIETEDRTIDQMMFDIMEKKNKISSLITEIIKESSVDCIQNTKDNFDLNQRCLRFSDLLQDEETIFPGVNAETLNLIDTKQLKTKFLKKIQNNLYVVSAIQDNEGIKRELYIYYEIETRKDPDIRYIRENGKRVCDVDLLQRKIYFYENKKHEMNKLLGPKFSIYQTIYNISPELFESITKDEELKFPKIDNLSDIDYILGYSIRYNVNERLFFKYYSDKIMRLYDYTLLNSVEFMREPDFESLVIFNGKFYLSK